MPKENFLLKVCEASFATHEDWEIVCEEFDVDPETTESITMIISKAIIEDRALGKHEETK